MNTEKTNATAWHAYGDHHLQRGTTPPDVDRIDWGFWGIGPGAEVLGELSGKRVLDLGCGLGRHAAYLVREHGAVVDALDSSPSQHQRARARYGNVPGLRLVLGDAVEHLGTAEPYDVIYSMNAFPYIAPHRLLPSVARALRPGGTLCFTALHTNSHGRGPSPEVTARPEILPLPGGGELTVHMWVLTPELWGDLLVGYGFLVDRVDVLDSPEDDSHVSYRLYHVRRRARIIPPP